MIKMGKRIGVKNFFGKLTYVLLLVAENEGNYIEEIRKKMNTSFWNRDIRGHFAMLVKLGLVELKGVPGNKRIRLVYLTPEGKTIVDSKLKNAFWKIKKLIREKTKE